MPDATEKAMAKLAELRGRIAEYGPAWFQAADYDAVPLLDLVEALIRERERTHANWLHGDGPDNSADAALERLGGGLP